MALRQQIGDFCQATGRSPPRPYHPPPRAASSGFAGSRVGRGAGTGADELVRVAGGWKGREKSLAHVRIEVVR